MALELQLPPGKTTTIQLLTRVVGSDTPGSNVGSSIAGVPDVINPTIYEFNLGAYATGDYWAQLSGVSNPVALPFPVRDSVAYVGYSWDQVDIADPQIPVAPTQPVAGLCNVMVSVTFNGEAVVGGKVLCHLEDKNNTVNGFIASRAVEEGVTDSLGNCVLTLIQFGQFTRGGVYRLKVLGADGKLLHDRRVLIPNTTTANAEDLVDAA
jgi:hypothetical protein